VLHISQMSNHYDSYTIYLMMFDRLTLRSKYNGMAVLLIRRATSLCCDIVGST